MSHMNAIFNTFNYCTMKERLETFKHWPFSDSTACSALKMAEAGFYQPNPLQEHDLVKCFICMKELNGWEEDDDPWKEHGKHQNTCEFVKLNKKESEMTVEDLLTLWEASVLRTVEKIHDLQREKLKDQFSALSKAVEKKWKKKK